MNTKICIMTIIICGMFLTRNLRVEIFGKTIQMPQNPGDKYTQKLSFAPTPVPTVNIVAPTPKPLPRWANPLDAPPKQVGRSF